MQTVYQKDTFNSLRLVTRKTHVFLLSPKSTKIDHVSSFSSSGSGGAGNNLCDDETLRIQICPEKGITPIFLFWGWD